MNSNAPFDVPIRTTSLKRKYEPGELEKEKHHINHDVKNLQKRVKPQSSFTEAFWAGSAEIAKKHAEKKEIEKKISLMSFKEAGNMEADWWNSDEANELIAAQNRYKLEEKTCRQQAKRLRENSGKPDGKFRRVLMQLFTSSTRGLGIKDTGEGERDSSKQSDFKNALIQAYGVKDPDTDLIWDPILQDWVEEIETRASHLFAVRHGYEMMDEFFGAGSKADMFSANNGLCLYSKFEEEFDSGFFVIVPKLPDSPSQAQIESWKEMEPKEYQIRIIDLNHRNIDKPIRYPSTKTWRQLDRSPLVFRNNFRPKARYLYYHYCCQILQRSWKEHPKGTTLKKEVGKSYWGTPGRYVAGNMLKALVEEMGQDYEKLMEGAIEEPGTEFQSDVTLVQCGLIQAKDKEFQRKGREENEESSDEDSDEEQ